jgi:hypothetical protein
MNKFDMAKRGYFIPYFGYDANVNQSLEQRIKLYLIDLHKDLGEDFEGKNVRYIYEKLLSFVKVMGMEELPNRLLEREWAEESDKIYEEAKKRELQDIYTSASRYTGKRRK